MGEVVIFSGKLAKEEAKISHLLYERCMHTLKKFESELLESLRSSYYEILNTLRWCLEMSKIFEKYASKSWIWSIKDTSPYSMRNISLQPAPVILGDGAYAISYVIGIETDNGFVDRMSTIIEEVCAVCRKLRMSTIKYRLWITRFIEKIRNNFVPLFVPAAGDTITILPSVRWIDNDLYKMILHELGVKKLSSIERTEIPRKVPDYVITIRTIRSNFAADITKRSVLSRVAAAQRILKYRKYKHAESVYKATIRYILKMCYGPLFDGVEDNVVSYYVAPKYKLIRRVLPKTFEIHEEGLYAIYGFFKLDRNLRKDVKDAANIVLENLCRWKEIKKWLQENIPGPSRIVFQAFRKVAAAEVCLPAVFAASIADLSSSIACFISVPENDSPATLFGKIFVTSSEVAEMYLEMRKEVRRIPGIPRRPNVL